MIRGHTSEQKPGGKRKNACSHNQIDEVLTKSFECLVQDCNGERCLWIQIKKLDGVREEQKNEWIIEFVLAKSVAGIESVDKEIAYETDVFDE